MGERLAELRAGDASGMNPLHWAAGRDASGSVLAAEILLEAEKILLRHRRPSLERRSGICEYPFVCFPRKLYV